MSAQFPTPSKSSPTPFAENTPSPAHNRNRDIYHRGHPIHWSTQDDRRRRAERPSGLPQDNPARNVASWRPSTMHVNHAGSRTPLRSESPLRPGSAARCGRKDAEFPLFLPKAPHRDLHFNLEAPTRSRHFEGNFLHFLKVCETVKVAQISTTRPGPPGFMKFMKLGMKG
jgi:hypothetical protein